jgi:RimK family alpha-L-glutamate ligase
MSLRFAIVTDEPGWHGRRLMQAFKARGIASRYVGLNAAQLVIGDAIGVRMPGFDHCLPDAVFVRGIPGGTLEQVVCHLNMLHALKDLGVPVYNDGRAIERSVDKALTSLRLRLAGLPTPQTWITADREQALSIVRHESGLGRCLIVKPLFGSQGKGISLVRDTSALPAADEVSGVWYLQRFIGEPSSPASDWRVFVIGGRAVAAMRRSAQGWLANVAQGASCQAAVPEGALRDLAERAVACLGMAYAGVDIMRDPEGHWWLIEVNSIPAWKGLQSVCSIDIAGCLADDLLRRCASADRTGVVT